MQLELTVRGRISRHEVDAARPALAEMDVLAHRFLYFVDRAGAEGKVLYLGGDGAYGLVTAT
jgi:Sigma 54 modulation/S30EA ribosomal protein C terminus